MRNLNQLSRALPPLADVRRERSRRSLYEFTKNTKPDYLGGWFNQLIAAELQQFLADVIAGLQPRLMIFAPPRSGKSELFSRRFPAWAYGKHPILQMIAASYSSDLASRMNRDVQKIIDDDEYHATFPGTTLNGKRAVTLTGQALRNNDIFEIVGKGGSYRSAGVGGGITGMGADIAVIDDPVKDAKEANSATYRNGVWEWYTTTLYTRLSPRSGILLGMTRWHHDDLAGRLIKEMENGGEKWRILSFPAIAEVDEEHRSTGEALHTDRYPVERLRKIQVAVGGRAWDSLFQQRPTAMDGGLFKPDKIETVDAIPAGKIEWVRGWDLAASSDGDYTVGGLLGKMNDGRFIIADIVRDRWLTDDRDQALKNTALRDGTGVKISVPQDPGQAGKSQALYITRALAGFSITTSTESGDKETRADPLASQVNVGNVLMLRGPWNKLLIDEMREFPNGANDDQVDALSRAFSKFLIANTGMLDFMQQSAHTTPNSQEITSK